MIEFDIKVEDAYAIPLTRIYYKTHYFEMMHMVERDKKFIAFAERLFRFVKSSLSLERFPRGKRVYAYYVGKEALQWKRDVGAVMGPGALVSPEAEASKRYAD